MWSLFTGIINVIRKLVVVKDTFLVIDQHIAQSVTDKYYYTCNYIHNMV